MSKDDDIEFLLKFREKIDRYLIVGAAPPENPFARDFDNQAIARMRGALATPNHRELLRTINEMKPRVKKILQELDLTPIMIQHPPPAVGGPVLTFHMLDLVTENISEFEVPKDRVLGVIDQAVGALRTMPPPQQRKGLVQYDLSKLHPRIRKECESLFLGGHYSESILKAYTVIAVMVKEKTGIDKDGRALMSEVFSHKSPILHLNEMRNQSERDEQEGFMLLFMGAMVGIRNPKAHDLIDQRDPMRTFEYLAFASLLARRIDEGKLSESAP
jgi:uncharacterized protein (TIGR02391 family)